MSEIDEDILFLLFKFYGMQVSQMSVILGVEEKKLARRVRALREKGFLDNALVLGGNEKALVFLKKRGMRALGEVSRFDWIDEVERREWTRSQMLAQHVKGEAVIAAWLALPKSVKTGNMGQLPVSYQQSERDVRSVAYTTTPDNTPRYLDKGLHMPDGIVALKGGMLCIEYERTVKPKSSRTQLADNMRANAERFTAQLWFVNSRTKKLVIEEAQKHPNWGVRVFDMADVEHDLAVYASTANLLGDGHINARALHNLPVIAPKKPVDGHTNSLGLSTQE